MYSYYLFKYCKKFKNEIDEYINKHIAIFNNELQMMGYDDEDDNREFLTYKLKYLTGAQKTKFKILENYVNNRDDIFKNFCNELGCSKDIIKELFNSLVNGGSYNEFKLKYIKKDNKEN